jgi:hypothetical protein
MIKGDLTRKQMEKEMKKLVFSRYTKEELIQKLNSLRVNREKDCFLEPFEEPLPENDFGFNTNLGMIGSHYLDFEIYMLPTNEPEVFLITEVNPF